jgi:hypothetical protein
MSCLVRLREVARTGLAFDMSYRMKQLEALQTMLTTHKQTIIDAVCIDLGA